jgi:hypothetical protein
LKPQPLGFHFISILLDFTTIYTILYFKKNLKKVLTTLKSICIINSSIYLNPDKAKPSVRRGRLPAVMGGGPTASEMEQAGKAADL